MLKRISPAVVFSLAASFFSVGGGIASASPPAQTGVIRATQETSHFTFYARPRHVETECEPTTAKALLIHGQRVAVPALFSNNAANGSVYIYEQSRSTCVSVVNWAKRRVIVHFTLVLLNTTTRL
jgi:hypothetical protein